MKSPQLLRIQDLRKLAEEAHDALYEDEDVDLFRDDPARDHEIAVALAALRFCAMNAAALKDTSLLPTLAAAIDIIDFYNDDAYDLLEVTLDAIKALLPLAPELPEEVIELASHENSEFRAALAEGLPTNNAQALELLEVLATDSFAEVRGPAQKKLSSLREISWWVGKFHSDPLVLLSDEDQITLKPTLENICKLLDLAYATKEQIAQLVSLAEQLPDVVLFALVRCSLSELEHVSGWQSSLLGVVLRHSGGCALVWEMITLYWSKGNLSYVIGHTIAEVMNDLPPEERASICLTFLTYLSVPESDSSEHKRGAVDIIVKGWPSEVDPSPVLEAILSEKVSASGIVELFRRPELNIAPILERFSEAHAAGYPGVWQALSSVGRDLLSRAPLEVLQRAVALVLDSERDHLVTWGIEQRLGRLYDEQHDPPRFILIEQLFTVPRYRSLFYKHYELGSYALPLLRRELVSGLLSFEEASAVMNYIGSLYGGFESFLGSLNALEKWEKRRTKVEPFFSLGAICGVASEQEWRSYRALRDSYQARGDPEDHWNFWCQALRLFPIGALPPEDKAFLQRALQSSEAGEALPELWLGFALSLDPSPEHLPFLERLAEEEDPDLTERVCKAIQTLQGTKSPTPSSHQDKSLNNWVDEDD